MKGHKISVNMSELVQEHDPAQLTEPVFYSAETS